MNDDMPWKLSNRAHPYAALIADRHYSRQKPGTRQFVSPGRCLVLLGVHGTALWVTSWPQYVRHAWPGAWVCALFRNEGAGLSSELIQSAVAATRWRYGSPPPAGMITFVDPSKVRTKRDPGRCFLRAGFRRIGMTGSRLFVLQLLGEEMPSPRAPRLAQEVLWPA